MWAWGAIFSGFFLYLTALLAYGPTPAPLEASVIIETNSGHGSGTFISPTQVITAKHVAEQFYNAELRVRGPDGSIYHILSASFNDADIAILTVDKPFQGVPLPVSCDPLERGDRLTYYGSPLNIEFAGPIELTYMAGKNKDGSDDPDFTNSTLLTNGEGEPGVSGAGVIDSSGRVVGVYNFAWNSTTFGGMVSLSYPAVCEFVTRELQPGANA
jgi:S1-C subfamily serine protease